MTQIKCRWGILGTAGIARKMWNAIQASPGGMVAAVGSRRTQRAATFIRECSRERPGVSEPLAIGDYQSLIEHPEVDVVYLPLPTAMRKRFVIDAARAGKHVLCEKPAAVNSNDLEEMVAECETAGVQFMDGVMFDHSIRWSAFLDAIHDPVKGLGAIRRIQTHFSFPGDAEFQASNIRANAQLEPHGCLGDLGWYCIRFTLGVMKGEMPIAVEARALQSLSAKGSDGSVPGEFSAELFFEGNRTANFYCSFLTANQQTASVSGEFGYATLDDFVLPFMRGETQFETHRNRLDIVGGRWDFRSSTELSAFDEYPGGVASSQEVRMVTAMNQQVFNGCIEPSFHAVVARTQVLLDACRRSDAAEGARVRVAHHGNRSRSGARNRRISLDMACCFASQYSDEQAVFPNRITA